jgi:hypothetical protein
LTNDSAHLIPCRLAQAVPAGNVREYGWFAGLDWWIPDIEVVCQLIRGVIDGTLPPPRSIRADILERYTWNRAALQLIELLAEAETLSPERPKRFWRWS